MRTVEYKPEDRYRTAGELRNELVHHLEKLMQGRVNYGMPAPNIGGETAQMPGIYQRGDAEPKAWPRSRTRFALGSGSC